MMQASKPAHVDQDDWDRLQAELKGISSGGATPAQIANARPDQLGNDPKMELQWAEQAGKHAETYMNLLKIVKDKKKLRLTKIDDEIYKEFRAAFPTLSVQVIDEDQLKSDKSKKKWRPFCMMFEHKHSDFNMATLLRLHAHRDYENPKDVTIVPRIQFFAVEIARNREGHNDRVYREHQAELEKKKAGEAKADGKSTTTTPADTAAGASNANANAGAAASADKPAGAAAAGSDNANNAAASAAVAPSAAAAGSAAKS